MGGMARLWIRRTLSYARFVLPLEGLKCSTYLEKSHAELLDYEFQSSNLGSVAALAHNMNHIPYQERIIMPLQQTALLIPDVIATGLKTGELIRSGSVVRNTAGQIVKHLAEVPIEPNTAVKAVDAVRVVAGHGAELTRKYPVVARTIGLAALAAGGTVAALSVRTNRARKAKIQERVNVEDRFAAASTAWIKAAEAGTVTSEIVSEVQEAWEEYEASNKEWDTQPNELALSLMQLVRTWNIQNGLRKNLSATADSFTDDVVVDFSAHLAAQREFFSASA